MSKFWNNFKRAKNEFEVCNGPGLSWNLIDYSIYQFFLYPERVCDFMCQNESAFLIHIWGLHEILKNKSIKPGKMLEIKQTEVKQFPTKSNSWKLSRLWKMDKWKNPFGRVVNLIEFRKFDFIWKAGTKCGMGITEF